MILPFQSAAAGRTGTAGKTGSPSASPVLSLAYSASTPVKQGCDDASGRGAREGSTVTLYSPWKRETRGWR